MGWSATREIPDRLRFSRHMKTTLFSHAILSYFARVQIYLYIEGNLKIVILLRLKNIEEIIPNHEGTRMVKDGEINTD